MSGGDLEIGLGAHPLALCAAQALCALGEAQHEYRRGAAGR